MERLFQYLIVILVLYLLYFFWSKKSFTFKKKYLFFLFAISISILNGCNLNTLNKTTIETNEGTNETKIETNEGINETTSRITELNTYQEWKEFKSFWKQLDNIESNQEGDSIGGSYYGAITHEEAEELKELLSGTIVGLESLPREFLKPLEISILKNLSQRRISYIAYGNMTMMTRMMPAPGQFRKEATIQELEDKIDMLLDLKKEGAIDQEEYNIGISNVENLILEFAIIDNISDIMIEYSLPETIDESALDKYLKSLELLEKKYIDELLEKQQGNIILGEKIDNETTQMFQRIREEIIELKSIYPGFNEVIGNLIK